MNCTICGSPNGRHWGSYGPTPACNRCHSEQVDQQQAALAVKPTCLYRLYDASGQLLYVGITSDIARRWKEHRTKHQGWWPQIAERRVIWFLERSHAWHAEREAVWAERPLHNDETTAYIAGTLPAPLRNPEPTPTPPPGEGWWRDERAVAEYTLAWKIWLAQLRDAGLSPEEQAEALVASLAMW
ncbi:GIY-YIG nuclease family protein [Streptomyces sp. NPDC094153]|uniref:GIY-YIG nuclease family protein n=1 Tax=Streptomyces sp. NPDC094153 TaxID=3366058 RepID=UPI0038112984